VTTRAPYLFCGEDHPFTAAKKMSTGSPLFTWLLWNPDMFRQNNHQRRCIATGRNLHLDDPPFAPYPITGRAGSLSLFET
jgi:hypothetical protein